MLLTLFFVWESEPHSGIDLMNTALLTHRNDRQKYENKIQVKPDLSFKAVLIYSFVEVNNYDLSD